MIVKGGGINKLSVNITQTLVNKNSGIVKEYHTSIMIIINPGAREKKYFVAGIGIACCCLWRI